jgi:ABC-type transporter Mla MlaB component
VGWGGVLVGLAWVRLGYSARPPADAACVNAAMNDVIMLPVELDRNAVGDIRASIDGARDGSTILLDGTLIRRVHTPGVQLLCALVLAAEGRGASVTWTAVPPVLVTYVNLLGIGDVIHFHGRLSHSLESFE